jgi:hypothetical protein
LEFSSCYVFFSCHELSFLENSWEKLFNFGEFEIEFVFGLKPVVLEMLVGYFEIEVSVMLAENFIVSSL